MGATTMPVSIELHEYEAAAEWDFDGRSAEGAEMAVKIMRDWSHITTLVVGGLLVDIYLPPPHSERDEEAVWGLMTLLNKIFVMPDGAGACKVFETDNALGIAVLTEAQWKWFAA